MNIQICKGPIEHVVVDNVYTPEELRLIWQELEFLTPKMKDSSHTGTARFDDGTPKKKNVGLFLDRIYSDRSISDILQLNRRTFHPDIVAAAELAHPFFGGLNSTNNDGTLVSYYDDSSEYVSHKDDAMFSAVTFFCKDRSFFEGGELVFSKYKHVIEPLNNRLVLFPSCIEHAVMPVRMKHLGPTNGRYSMAQFLSIV